MDTQIAKSALPVGSPSTLAPSERQVYLSDPQKLALEWLTNGGNITEAARYADVCRQTVSRWITEDPDFRAVYDAWRNQIDVITEGQLQQLAEPAVNTLAHAILHRNDTRAAQFVLRHLASMRQRK